MFLRLVLILQTIICTSCINKKEIIDEILNPKTYDKRIAPIPYIKHGIVAPATVNVKIHILSITLLPASEIEYDLMVALSYNWMDDRLSFNNHNERINYIHLDNFSNIWTPNLHFSNRKGGARPLLKPFARIQIHEDGTIRVLERIRVILPCNIKYKKFPFDFQKCQVHIESFQYFNDTVLLNWAEPVSVNMEKSNIPLFTLTDYFGSSELTGTSSEIYSRLNITLKLRRNLFFYMTRLFMPCIVLVVLSMLQFWFVQDRYFNSRIFIGVIFLLAMNYLIVHMNDQFQKVSGIRAIDIFTRMSMTFSFSMLVATTLIHFLKAEGNSTNAWSQMEQVESISENPSKLNRFKREFLDFSFEPNKINCWCQILFPTGYLFFNIFYWSICLNFDE